MPRAKFQSPSINIDRYFQISAGERKEERKEEKRKKERETGSEQPKM